MKKYLIGLLLFGANGVVASFIGLESGQIVLLRSVLGSALLTVLFLLGGKRFTGFKNRRDMLLLALSGAAMAADWLFLFESYKQIGVSLGMLINYTGPAIVIAFSPLVLKEKLTAKKLAALVLALTGAVLISGRAISGGVSVFGIVCAALSAMAYAVMVLSNKLVRDINGEENATVQLLFTTVIVVIFIGARQGFAMDIAGSDWLPILLLGFVNTGLACYLYFSSIGSLPAQTVAVCGYLEPLSAVLLSALILGERMSPVQVLGAVLIVGGALVGELKTPKKA